MAWTCHRPWPGKTANIDKTWQFLYLCPIRLVQHDKPCITNRNLTQKVDEQHSETCQISESSDKTDD